MWAVEAAKEDQGTAHGRPISRHFGFGFEDCQANVIEVGTPGCPAGVLFRVPCDDAAGKDDEGWEDLGE